MIVHYQNALMRPHVAVLQRLQANPLLDASSLPIVIQGAHSLVAKVSRADSSVLALKVPLSAMDVGLWRDRYTGLRRLSLTKLKGRIPGSLDVITDGIQIEGRDRPVLAADWVSGPTLQAAVARAAASRNADVLRALAFAVVELANAFRMVDFAHNGLTADNLIISQSGALVAVGLDRAVWAGGPVRATGSASPSYRHPDGEANAFEDDAFAILVLYASLRALAEAPELAARNVRSESVPGDALLFTTWDLADPGTAQTFADVDAIVSPDVREVVDALRQACMGEAGDINRWAQVIPGLKPISVPDGFAYEHEADPLPVTTPSSQGWDVAQAIDRIRTRVERGELGTADVQVPDVEVESKWKTWQQPTARAALSVPPVPLEERPQRPAPLPDHAEAAWPKPRPGISPPIQERASDPRPIRREPETRTSSQRAPANPVSWMPVPNIEVKSQSSSLPPIDRQRIEARESLQVALAQNDEATVRRLWSHLAGDPVAQTWTLQVEELVGKSVRSRIRHESDRKRDPEVVGLAESADRQGLVLDPATKKIVRLARERSGVRTRLELALAGDERERLADLAISGDLMALGDTDRTSLRRVLRALEWPALERGLATNDDQIIVSVFDRELWDNGNALSDDARNRIDLASRRLAWRADVRRALKAGNVSLLEEYFRQPPVRAIDRLSASERRRCRRLIEQRRALAELLRAISVKDDDSIVRALNHVERVGARIADRSTWIAIQSIVERTSLVEDIVSAVDATPMDVGMLAHLVPAARTLGIDGDPRLTGRYALDQLEQRLIQTAHMRRIRAAIARDDDAAIVLVAVPDPYNALEELSIDERARVAAAIVSRRRVDRKGVAARFDQATV